MLIVPFWQFICILRIPVRNDELFAYSRLNLRANNVEFDIQSHHREAIKSMDLKLMEMAAACNPGVTRDKILGEKKGSHRCEPFVYFGITGGPPQSRTGHQRIMSPLL